LKRGRINADSPTYAIETDTGSRGMYVRGRLPYLYDDSFLRRKLSVLQKHSHFSIAIPLNQTYMGFFYRMAHAHA